MATNPPRGSNGVPAMPKFVRELLIVLAGIVAVVTLLELFTIRVHPGEIGVRQNNVRGGIETEDLAVGYHVILPFVHRVYRVDSRYFFLNFSSTEDLGEEYEPLLIRTTGNNNVTVDATIPIRVIPGRAHALVADGLLVGEAYKVRAHNTAVGVLQEHLASLTSEQWYDVPARNAAAADALVALNASLEAFYLEAEQVNIRGFYFSTTYEQQLGRIQLLEQQQLLDRSQELLANSQQQLDNYANETVSQLNQRAAWWASQTALLETAYRIGINDTNRESVLQSLVDIALVNRRTEILALGLNEGTPQWDTFVAQVRSDIEAHLSGPHFAVGIEGIRAETNQQVALLEGRAAAMLPRYQAQADQIIEIIVQDGQERVNNLLAQPGGRALVALEAARSMQLGSTMTFDSRSMPFLFDLNGMARRLMGE
jgi:hypothetical protein